MTGKRFASLAFAILCLGPAAGQAQDAGTQPTVEQSIEDLKRAIVVRDRVIRNLLDRLEALEAKVSAIQPDPEPAPAPPAPEEAAPRQAASPQPEAAQPPALSESERREQEQLVRTAFERTLIERGGLLLPPGTVEIEPSVSYINSSSDNIVIDGFTILPVLVVGDIYSERIRRNAVNGALTARVGVLPNLQVDVRVPYGYQSQKTLSADNERTALSHAALGDVELALSRQLLRGAGWAPDVLASLRWKTTTGGSPFDNPDTLSFGSGYDSFSGSLTAVKVSDPVVYFGNLSYSHNMAVSEDIGRFNPGNSLGFQLGMAVALNLDAAISFAYEQRFSNASLLDGVSIPGSSFTTGSFLVGSSYALTPSFSLDFSVGIGVTEDAPDAHVSFSAPFRIRF